MHIFADRTLDYLAFQGNEIVHTTHEECRHDSFSLLSFTALGNLDREKIPVERLRPLAPPRTEELWCAALVLKVFHPIAPEIAFVWRRTHPEVLRPLFLLVSHRWSARQAFLRLFAKP